MIPRLIGLKTRAVANRTLARNIARPRNLPTSFHTRVVLRNSLESSPPGKKQRLSLKELSKKYGWTAVGVYFALSAIDLPLCFLFVHSMGQEKSQEIEKRIKEFLGRNTEKDPNQEISEADSKWGTLLTELGIAYAIHKSVFIFVRIPATAAITPWAVRTLQKWGFNIGKSATTAGKASLGTPPTTKQRFGSGFF